MSCRGSSAKRGRPKVHVTLPPLAAGAPIYVIRQRALAEADEMFKTVLIANRGEIAVRIARTLKRMGIRSVAAYSDADRDSLHVAVADVAIALGGKTPAESYLRGERLLAIAKQTGAEAIIPGYGFLSENAGFAEQCATAGIVFVGPTPEQIRRFGLKHTSREIAAAAGVPLTPGSGLLKDLVAATEAARAIGYPVMLKSTAGGGGIGLSRCDTEAVIGDLQHQDGVVHAPARLHLADGGGVERHGTSK